jgi:hypothetical protein
MNGSNYIPVGLLTYTVVTGLMASARTAKAKLSGTTEVFDAKPSLKALLVLCIVGFSFGSIYVLMTPPRSLFGSIVFALIAFSGIIAFPAPIFLTSDGVQQVKFWGKHIYFTWPNVTKVDFHKGPFTTVLISSSGQRVVHTGFHVASEHFREECVRRSQVPLVSTEF